MKNHVPSLFTWAFWSSMASGGMRSFAITLALVCLTSCATGIDAACERRVSFEREQNLDVFFKGNTHTHTERSFDSSESVSDVLMWFRHAGYNFVVLTDHDSSAVPGEFSALESETFITIAGEEITSSGVTGGGEIKPVHVNSICSNGATVGGTTLDGNAHALRDAVDRAIDIAGAIAQVNHPNYHYALRARDIRSANAARLLEIANQHPEVNNTGNKTHISTEEMWDKILSRGGEIYAVASDDTHELAAGSYTPPGKGWIQVAAKGLSSESICDALREGLFYASTGVELKRLTVTRTQMQVEILPEPGTLGEGYATTFTGRRGKVLQRLQGLRPTYELSGNQQYVRATITGPDGKLAWTQPSFVTRSSSCE